MVIFCFNDTATTEIYTLSLHGALPISVAEPFALAAGVYVSVPLADTAGCPENSVVLLLLTMKFNVCDASLVGPALRFVAPPVTYCAAASSSTVLSAPLVKLGASLTAVTVMVIFFFNDTATTEIYTLSLHDALPISVAEPFALAAGV